MKMLKMLFAAAAAVMMTLLAQAATTAKAVLDTNGRTLRFVYDDVDWGTKDEDWFSVAEAEAIDPHTDGVPWDGCGGTVDKVVFDSSFADYRPSQCGSWLYNFQRLTTVEGIENLNTSGATCMAYMFSRCSHLNNLDLSSFDTAKVTDMDSMFSDCSLLEELDLSSFNTERVNDAAWMFRDCSELTTIFVSDAFVTTAMAQSGGMFANCTALVGGNGTVYDSAKTDKTYARIGRPGAPGYFSATPRSAKALIENGGKTLRFVYDDVDYGVRGSSWFRVDSEFDPDYARPWIALERDLVRVVFEPSFAQFRPVQGYGWFQNLGLLEAIDGLENFNTAAMTDMSYMFSSCGKLASLDLSGFDTSRVKTMEGMFYESPALTSLNLGHFNTANVKSMAYMFFGCSSLKKIYASDAFVTTGVTSIYDDMFWACENLVGGKGTAYSSNRFDKTYARIDGGSSAPGYFTAVPPSAKAVVEDGGATLRFVYDNLDYGPKGTNWFSVAEAEAIDPFSDSAPWEELGETVTKVVFDSSFAGYRPVQCGSWFYNFEWLSQIEGIGNLKTSSATGMAYMFSGCSSLTSLDLSGFDTAQVTSMNSMFSNCSSLKSLNLSGFDTAKVKDTLWMFNGCRSLTTIYASDAFVTGGITESGAMFASCTALKGGAGTTYDSTKQDKTYARIDGGAAVPGYFTAMTATAKVVVEDGGTTLRFVYDDLGYGEKDVDWFSVKDAEAIVEPADEDVPWVARGGTVTKVVFDKSFADYRPSQCSCWFWNFGKLATIDGVKNLDTSSAKSLAYMFGKCSKLVSLDLSGFDTSKVTNMDGMFRDCTSLTTIYASEKFVTAQVTQSSGVFYQCDSLVGGNGTPFDSGSIAYARIDAPGEPGYFTAVPLIAKVVVEDDGATLRFVYDDLVHGEKDVDWFSVAEAEARAPSSNPPWHSCADLVTKVVFDESFADYRPSHCGCWFSDFENLEKIDGLRWLDTSAATSMTAMFYGCSSLTSLDLSTLDTSEVTGMYQMFEDCSSLVLLDLTGFDTAKVTNMAYMFCNCSSLTTIYASDSFVTTAVTIPVGMFYGCTSLKGGMGTTYDSAMSGTAYARIDGGPSTPGYFTRGKEKEAKVVVEDGGATLRFVCDRFDYGTKGMDWFSVAEAEAIDPFSDSAPWEELGETVTKVVFDSSFADYRPVQCGSWFYNFEWLSQIEGIGNLKTSSATGMAYMFSGCSSLTSLDLSGFDTAQVTSMDSMFSNCSSLKSLNLSGFDTANVTDTMWMFAGCSLLTSLDVSGFDTAKVTDMFHMFNGCSSLESLDVTGFDTANVDDMSGMFNGCSSLESLDVTGFDTANVDDMSGMFYGCSLLERIYASDRFVTTKETWSANMFTGCTALKGGNGTAYDAANPADATYARIDGGPSAPGYFTLKTPVGGYAAWAAAKGLTGANAAWDAKPAMWGGTWENGFIYTFGEGLADGTLAIMSIAFDANGKPVITTAPVVEGHTDFTPAVIGTLNLRNWSSPVVLENKSGDDWTLPAGKTANFFRVRLSE